MENSTPTNRYDYYAFDRRMKAKWDSMTEEEIKKESDDFYKLCEPYNGKTFSEILNMLTVKSKK